MDGWSWPLTHLFVWLTHSGKSFKFWHWSDARPPLRSCCNIQIVFLFFSQGWKQNSKHVQMFACMSRMQHGGLCNVLMHPGRHGWRKQKAIRTWDMSADTIFSSESPEVFYKIKAWPVIRKFRHAFGDNHLWRRAFPWQLATWLQYTNCKKIAHAKHRCDTSYSTNDASWRSGIWRKQHWSGSVTEFAKINHQIQSTKGGHSNKHMCIILLNSKNICSYRHNQCSVGWICWPAK